MTSEQLIEEIRRLPMAQRLELLEAVSRSLREELEPREDSQADGQGESNQADAQGSDQNATTLSQRLRGILKFDGDPPTDEEVKDAYADYLLEKYS